MRQLFACLALLIAAHGAVRADDVPKRLKVFILAGQSNMVGHAQYHTIPALLTAEEPGVKQLAKLIFKEGAIAPGDTRHARNPRQTRCTGR